MPIFQEAAFGIYGAWRLAWRKTDGLQWFDKSIDGFWRSFFAFILIAPGEAAWRIMMQEMAPVSSSGFRIMLVYGITYVVTCVAYPLVMIYLCDVFDKAARYTGFIVALNWSRVLQMAVMLPVTLLALMDAEPGLEDLLYLLALAAILYYQWFVTLTTLEVSGMVAAGAVVVDVMIILLVEDVATALLQGAAGPA